MTEKMYEELKKEAFMCSGVIEDLLGYEVDKNEEKDVTESRLDEVFAQMPEDIALAFYKKYVNSEK